MNKLGEYKVFCVHCALWLSFYIGFHCGKTLLHFIPHSSGRNRRKTAFTQMRCNKKKVEEEKIYVNVKFMAEILYFGGNILQSFPLFLQLP